MGFRGIVTLLALLLFFTFVLQISLHPIKQLQVASFPVRRDYLACEIYERRNNNGPLIIFFAVFTTVAESEIRNTLRETWLTQQDVNITDAIINWRFFLTNPRTIDDKLSILKEKMMYGDVVILDLPTNFISEFNKILLREAMAFKWISINFPSTTFIIKSNSNTFINLPFVVPVLKETLDKFLMKETELYVGQLVKGGEPRRDTFTKYWVSVFDYPLDKYAPFMSGGCFGMTLNLAVHAADLILRDPCVDFSNGLDGVVWGLLVHGITLNHEMNVRLVNIPGWIVNFHRTLTWPQNLLVLHKVQGETTLRLLYNHFVRQKRSTGGRALQKCNNPDQDADAPPPIVVFEHPLRENVLCWQPTVNKISQGELPGDFPPHQNLMLPDKCYDAPLKKAKRNRFYVELLENDRSFKLVV